MSRVAEKVAYGGGITTGSLTVHFRVLIELLIN